MGPDVEAAMARFLLRPFRTAQTYRNLKAHGEGVLHVTDDVLLLARSAVGPVDPPPVLFHAEKVRGRVLRDACRYYEFRVRSLDDREERTRIEAEVVHAGSRLHFGLLSLGREEAWPDRTGAATVPARRFGGVGLMVEAPGLLLHARPAAAWSAEGPLADRALAFARRLLQAPPGQALS